jgi:hypothetical protein
LAEPVEEGFLAVAPHPLQSGEKVKVIGELLCSFWYSERVHWHHFLEFHIAQTTENRDTAERESDGVGVLLAGIRNNSFGLAHREEVFQRNFVQNHGLWPPKGTLHHGRRTEVGCVRVQGRQRNKDWPFRRGWDQLCPRLRYRRLDFTNLLPRYFVPYNELDVSIRKVQFNVTDIGNDTPRHFCQGREQVFLNLVIPFHLFPYTISAIVCLRPVVCLPLAHGDEIALYRGDIDEAVKIIANDGLAENIMGGLSHPSRMPGSTWDMSATRCTTGAILPGKEVSICSTCYAMKSRYPASLAR